MFFQLKKMIFQQNNIAVDLGTANTRIYTSGNNRITEEPSVIRHYNPREIAKLQDEYIWYLNSRLISMPLRGGVIVDINNAVKFLKPLVRHIGKSLKRTVSLACAPTDASEKERGFLADAILHSGASHVAIIPEVWAAAVGAGINVEMSKAQALIDIGEGVTDMAVIRSGRLIFASAVRTACSDLQKSIRTAMMAKHKVYLFPSETERLTHELSSMHLRNGSDNKLIGIDIIKKRRTVIEVKNTDIINAMEPVVHQILKMIELGLQKLPENVFGEISETGFCLTGGGACIKGIDRLISAKTCMDVRIAPDPIHSVINGAIRTLTYWKEKENWWEHITWPKLL